MSFSFTPGQDFIAALDHYGFKRRPDGNGYRCQCPGHSGKGFNLAVKEGNDGKLLLHCHSHECSTEDICTGVGLSLKDLFPNGVPQRRSQVKVKVDDKEVTLHRTSDLAIKALAWSLHQNGQIDKDQEPKTIWDYHDANGDIVGKVVRWQTPEGKEIRQIRKHGIGWMTKAMEFPRPLYRLPELLSSHIVYITEGEKAADAITTCGVCGASPSQGSKSPQLTDWSVLDGKQIVISPDRDEAGREFVNRVLGLLQQQAPSASVKVIHLWDDLSELEEGGDAHEWSEYYDAQPVEWLQERLQSLPDRVDEYTLEPSDVELVQECYLPNFIGKPAADLWARGDEPVPWLVTDVFSADQPTVFGAKRKCLKTTILTDLAVSLTSGLQFLGHFDVPNKLRVLFVTGESNERAAIRRIQRAAKRRNLKKEDLTRLWVEAVDFPKLPNEDHVATMANHVRKNKIDVVILDPLYRGMDGSINASNLFEVGDCLGNFMAKMRPVPVIIAHHFRKNSEFQDGVPDLDDLAQAGIAEFAGNFWLVARNGTYDGDGKHDLAVLFGGRDEQYGLKRIEFDEREWSATISDLKAHREHVKQRKENEKAGKLLSDIMAELRRVPNGMSESAIADAVSVKKSRQPFRDAISELEQRRSIVCVPDFKSGNGHKCKGWRIAELQNKK